MARRLERSPSPVIVRLFALLLACVPAAALRAALIPADRLVDWTPGVAVGVPGGIDQYLPGGAHARTHLIDVTQAPYNADNTGTNDASGAIQAAINAATAGDVVYLPAGTYLIVKGVGIGPSRSGITLRGTGDTTIIKNESSSTGIFVGTASDYNWSWPSSGNQISAGLTKGSTQLTMADTSAFSVGQMVQIRVNNDATLPVVSVSGFEGLRRQMMRINGKTATTLSVYPAVYADYSAQGAVAYAARLQVNNAGVEDMLIDSSSSSGTATIEFEQCYGCWIKNVHVRFSHNYQVFLYDSLNCEIRHCYLDQINHAGSNGAGLLCNTISGCLVEDNIIYKAFPLIEVNQGSSGNVFAYNYLDASSPGCAIDTNHGPHNEFNLYEGNIAPNVEADGYFGSVSDDTFFRNWLTGMNDGTPTYTLTLKRFTRNYSFAANLLGTSDKSNGMYSFGQPNIGNGSYSGSVQPSAGTDWPDLHLIGTLTTRSSDSAGVFTLPAGTGDLAVGQWPVSVFWSNTSRTWETVKSITSSTVTLGDGSNASGGSALPTEGSTIKLWPGPLGFQELDLDVEATTLRKGNYLASASGGGSIPTSESLNGETLPASLYRTSKPSWFGFLTWPAFDPNHPNQSPDAIPAGYRYLHGVDPVDTGATVPPAQQQPFNVRIWPQRK